MLKSGTRNERGQSIVEVILAMMIFGTIAGVLVSLALGGFRSLSQGGEQTEAEALAQQGIEAVRAVRDEAYNQMVYDQSGVEVSGGGWVLSGEGTTDSIGKYTRTISFASVCRDASDDLTACPGSYTDVQSKEITVTVSWTTTGGKTNTVKRIAYLTNWDSQEWTEDVTADFSDGTFSSTENSTTLGDADGAIILQTQ